MKKVLIAAAAVLAAGALLGVGVFIGRDLERSNARTAPKGEVEITDTLPAPTAPTTTTLEDVKIGATQDYKDADGYHIRFTVFRYRELGETPYRPTHRSVAVEVRGTVLAAPPPDEFGFGGAPRLSWMAWTLQDAAGRTWEAEAGGEEDFELYPEDKATPVGTSRRGWIPFQLPSKAKPTPSNTRRRMPTSR